MEISAKGKDLCKAVSVAEVLKRELKGQVKQVNTLKPIQEKKQKAEMTIVLTANK